MSEYLSELKSNWRPLLAACIGMSCGMSVVGTIASTLEPNLLAETKWDKAEFTAVGGLAVFMAVVFPFIGRLTDLLGVRKTALIGQTTLPLVYLAYSRLGGEGGGIGMFKLIFCVQSLLCVTTTATVYSRLAVQYTQKARGMALAIVVSGPAVMGMIIAQLLNPYVESHGWRAGYEAAAIFAAVGGLITFLLIPAGSNPVQLASQPKRRARDDYPRIFRTPAFWFLVASMALVNLPQTLLLRQVKFLMEANGIGGKDVAMMLSAGPFGMLAGRFAAGFALDRISPYLVAFVMLSIPSLGLFIIASSYDAPWVLTLAVISVGFAFGAEGDVLAFLVARTFGVEIYSSVMGMVTAVTSMSTASGAILLGKTMEKTGNYDLFLIICGFAVLAGAACLLVMGRFRTEVAT